ncbi:MAG: DUF86 domain-containing protein [bacterium]|nr:DUF86 domain-containing protein [bacterium]
MDDMRREIAVEKEHITETLAALSQALDRKDKTVVELAAIATFLQNIYNGIENLLKRILKYKGILVPRSESSHKDLLDLAVEHRLISLELSNKLDEYRGFRHFVIHGYGIMLDAEQLIPLAEHIPTVWKELETELNQLS